MIFVNSKPNNKKSPGRPKGLIKEARLDVMIEPTMKRELKKITKERGTNVSSKVCELIYEYIKKERLDVK